MHLGKRVEMNATPRALLLLLAALSVAACHWPYPDPREPIANPERPADSAVTLSSDAAHVN